MTINLTSVVSSIMFSSHEIVNPNLYITKRARQDQQDPARRNRKKKHYAVRPRASPPPTPQRSNKASEKRVIVVEKHSETNTATSPTKRNAPLGMQRESQMMISQSEARERSRPATHVRDTLEKRLIKLA